MICVLFIIDNRILISGIDCCSITPMALLLLNAWNSPNIA